MDAFFNNISHRKTKITVLATHALVRSSLQFLLETERQFSILDAVGASCELIEKISRNKPNVVLICLVENEGRDIGVISDLLKVVPQTKIVILSSPNSLLSQAAALQMGVAAVVGANENARTLVRAIKQVSAGETWLNQKVIVKLLDEDFNSPTNGASKTKPYFKGDDLTRRELEVVRMIGLGLTNKDISKRLHIGETTVRHHLSSIYSKLNVEDRLNLAIYAHRQRIV